MGQDARQRSSRWGLGFAVTTIGVGAGAGLAAPLEGQGIRLLGQPSLSDTEVVFGHGGDPWVASRIGGNARRPTRTPAAESEPLQTRPSRRPGG